MADNWILESIKPKTDQLNAEDLIDGPIDVTIQAVRKTSDQQQPMEIVIGNGRQPYKPNLSMRRVLIAMFGKVVDSWVGKELRLFRNPNIKCQGFVGGIQISNGSIDKPIEIMLTVSRGVRKPYRVEPMPNSDKKPDIATRVAKAIEAIKKANSADLIDKYQVTIETELLDKCTVEQRTALKDAVSDALARIGG